MILEIHLHAGFLSGHMDLAGITGAEIVVPASAGCPFPHKAVRDGDSFMLEDMRISVVETPGHTPEYVSYVVADTSRGEEPVGVFTGDTLFVGDAGRPGLFPGRAEELAGKLFHSLQKLKELPRHCEVWPAHGAGSLCGRAVGAKYRSTIGYEKLYNPVLQIDTAEGMIRHQASGIPQAPDHFSRCSEINRKGPGRIWGSPPLPQPLLRRSSFPFPGTGTERWSISAPATPSPPSTYPAPSTSAPWATSPPSQAGYWNPGRKFSSWGTAGIR